MSNTGIATYLASSAQQFQSETVHTVHNPLRFPSGLSGKVQPHVLTELQALRSFASNPTTLVAKSRYPVPCHMAARTTSVKVPTKPAWSSSGSMRFAHSTAVRCTPWSRAVGANLRKRCVRCRNCVHTCFQTPSVNVGCNFRLGRNDVSVS